MASSREARRFPQVIHEEKKSQALATINIRSQRERERETETERERERERKRVNKTGFVRKSSIMNQILVLDVFFASDFFAF